jgi:hypothetical protein
LVVCHKINSNVEKAFGVSKGQKGKIAAAEWPSIAARHRRGESLASIARAYGCTAPAIAYIVKRSASGEAKGEAAGPGAEPPRPAARAAPAVGLDARLRERVNSDVAAFLVAFEAACDELTGDTCRSLLDATDRLLRAGARTRIEIERWAERR